MNEAMDGRAKRFQQIVAALFTGLAADERVRQS